MDEVIEAIVVESTDQLPITVESSLVTARSVGGYKRHLAIITKELDKIVSVKNYARGRESIRLLTQIDEAYRKYEQAVLNFLKNVPETSDHHSEYSEQLAATKMEVSTLKNRADAFITKEC